jgi:hypothetical protein
MGKYAISYDGWEANQYVEVKAENESEAIHKVLTEDGAPWASVIEVELLA